MGNNNSNLIAPDDDIEYNAPVVLESKKNLQKIIEYQQYTITKLNKILNPTKENFTSPLQSPSQSQSFALQPLSSPDIQTYINTYNDSIALVDDPANINRVNFDTYIHLQNKKLSDLQNTIKAFPTNVQVDAPVKSIKNMLTSKLLNVEEYKSKEFKPNGAPDDKYPNYLIYGNNGCLQYTKASNDLVNPLNNKPGEWTFTSCNANDANQRFTKSKISNTIEYNAKITDKKLETYKINNVNSTTLPFYVVNPETAVDQCLMLNNDGLSVMPCNMTADQRFKLQYRSIIP